MLPTFQDLLTFARITSRRRGVNRELTIESLECRTLLSVQSLSIEGKKLIIQADDSATNVSVSQWKKLVVVNDVGSDTSWNYSKKAVREFEFRGGNGNDQFTNDTSLSSSAFGNNGDDILIGGSSSDHFEGGFGDDILLGMGGDDELYGQEGDDQINGREGNDFLSGGIGADILISIDGSTGDSIDPGDDIDIVWVDSGSSSDLVSSSSGQDYIQYVSGFANGADRSLDGDRINDPRTSTGETYKTFANRPLFASNGPSPDDINQGYLGDCYFLAGLSAIAKDSPQTLMNYIVDFNDGTYGVRLGDNFYRVDNDLPVFHSYNTSPAYAGFGAEGSMWVAIAEKAFAHYRTGANSYGSIEGGWGVEANLAFGATSTGNRDFLSYGSADALANQIYTQWSNNTAITIGFLSVRTSAGSTAPLIMSHMYTVMSVVRDAGGTVTSLVLRNPWGVDGTGSDGNYYDGLVTVTPDQIYGISGRINWGQV